MTGQFSRQSAQGPRQIGFTLIEVLVVLILFSLIGGVLFQALERTYRLEERFGTELFNVQQGQMVTEWYRQTVQGLYPDSPGGHNLVRGTDREYSGLSSNPLSNEYGAPTPISWKIRSNQQTGGTELVYLEGKQISSILAWHGINAKFIYFDEKQTPHERWPPALGLFPQLPSQIQLLVKGSGEHSVIIASPRGPAQSLPRLQDQ